MPTDKQLRELEIWIHRHIFEGDLYVGLKKHGLWYRPNAAGYTDRQSEAGRYTRHEAAKHEYPHQPNTLKLVVSDPVTICEFEAPRYTTQAADALEVLKKCLEKTGGAITGIVSLGAEYRIKLLVNEHEESVRHETLELAICLFAKKCYGEL